MIVKTLFQHDGRFALGEVEIKLLPGIPILHVVGQPDSHIRECGIKLKSALRSCEMNWPKGHQIVVNLRPSYFRKSSSGADLAIALGFLALTGQLNDHVKARLAECTVYGELSLDGRVFAPPDLPSALKACGMPLITGTASEKIRDGEWLELPRLDSPDLKSLSRHFDWRGFWQPPDFKDLELHPKAAEDLCLAVHMNLNVLIGGPQGSGKTTWAKALFALTPPPEPEKMTELREMFGDEVLKSRWRPCESPHHSITPLAMIGGGAPIFPGVISRAHGGVLVMDEFLEFHPQVLEGLREPAENGFVEHARKGERARFPSSFQLIGTTNLCPCGKLNPEPGVSRSCSSSLIRCRSISHRLSGPIMDRFDVLVFSHQWLLNGERRKWSEIKQCLTDLREFREMRGQIQDIIPDWVGDLELSHRRRRALLRVARGLADIDHSVTIQGQHLMLAYKKVIDPMEALRQLFG